MRHSLDGRVAVVTGTQGIGLAIAKEFVEEGRTLYLHRELEEVL